MLNRRLINRLMSVTKLISNILKEIMAMELTSNNLVIIYTSEYLHMIEDIEEGKELETE